MAEVIEDPKKKKASFGDAAAAATDPGITQLNVGRPGDFPVNPDGTPMQKMAAPSFGAGAPAPVQPIGSPVAAFAPGTRAVMSGFGEDAKALAEQGKYGAVVGQLGRAVSAMPIAMADDLLGPAIGMAKPLLQGGANAIKTFVTGDNTQANVGLTKPAATQKVIPGAGDATMPGNDPTRFMAPAQSDAPLPAAPNPTAVLQSGVPPVPAGAVQTQGQMNMEADLKSAEAMKAERLAAEGRAPQAVVTHSGNDWQARNNLRNLEVSASSMTARPQDVQAYANAQKHDTSLQGGSTTADVANLAAANRHNEINSTAQIANARTAQQGEQFGASQELAKQRLALDSKTQGAQAAQYGAEARLKGVQANAAEQLAALQNKYMTAKPEEQAAIAKQIRTLSNKADKAQLLAVNQPDTMAPDGMTKLGGGQRLVVQGEDGSFREVPMGGEQAAGISADARAIAIRDNKSMSVDEKRKQLQALGYK